MDLRRLVQAREHLLTLRAWLRRDFLTTPSWSESLAQTARAAVSAVRGRRALIALKAEDGAWVGYADNGATIDEETIRVFASRTLLEQVHDSQEPVITSVTQPLVTRSKSIDRNDISNVLVAPLRTWKRDGENGVARPLGCLYVDRAGDEPPFEQSDIDLVLDLTNMLERTVNVLKQLSAVETELERARSRMRDHAEAQREAFQLHSVRSRDPGYIRSVLEPLKRAARAERVGVLLIGPTGAGKSHLAQSFHYESRRRDGPFVVLDCGQVSSSEALGAELFGFAKHSGFNAPKEGRLGKARLADGGTLFIDEVATLPLDLQQRLLRLIQHGRFTPLGGSEEQDVDVQVVAASNEDLPALVRERRFREDLYWRLAEVAIRVPSLEEHKADLPELVDVFLGNAARRFARGVPVRLTPDAVQRLVDFPWSRAGNTRGLEHAINRSLLLAGDDQEALGAEDLVLPELLTAPDRWDADGAVHGPSGPVPPAAGRGLREVLERLVDDHGGVLAKVAADPRLASAWGLPNGPVPVSTVRFRIHQLGLDERLESARGRREVTLEQVLEALREHHSAVRAAAALGITRDALMYRLRQAGLGVREALERDGVEP